METEFITYEQALALKALGFDIPCFGYFDCERDFQFVPNKKKFLLCEVARPTFSQTFRWLYQNLDIEKGVMPLDYESQQLLLKELIDKVSSKHLLV